MKVIFHQGLKVTKRGVSGEADLSLGVQGNQEGCLMKVVFCHGFKVTKRGVSQGVLLPWVQGNQEVCLL